MNDYTRGYFAVQLPMDADAEQVQRAIERISRAFGLTATNSAPAADAQITPQEIVNAELDADGLPWDERIHAGSKTRTQKGVWTSRRGLDEAVRDAVIAELRQMYPVAEVAAPAAAAPVAPVAEAAPVTEAAPVAPVAPVISIAPAQLTPYSQLVDWIAKNTGVGKSLPANWADEQFAANGMSLPQLATNQELSAAFLDAFRNALKSMGVAEA